MSKKLKIYVTKLSEENFSVKLASQQNAFAKKYKDGFSTHKAAVDYMKLELDKINEKNEKNKIMHMLEGINYEHKTFYEIGQLIKEYPQYKIIKEALDLKMQMLKYDIFYQKVNKEGKSEKQADKEIRQLLGNSLKETLEKCNDKTFDSIKSLTMEKQQEHAKSLAQYALNSLYVPSQDAKNLLNVILKIEGKKIITILLEGREHPLIFDISATNEVGYAPEHMKHLCKYIDEAFDSNTNVFTLRQFINNSYEKFLVGKKEIQIPWKAVYGFLVSKEGIMPIDADSLEESYGETPSGEKIEKEDFVIYKDFSVILDKYYERNE